MKAYWLDYGMSFVSGPAQWRLPIGTCSNAVYVCCGLTLYPFVLSCSVKASKPSLLSVYFYRAWFCPILRGTPNLSWPQDLCAECDALVVGRWLIAHGRETEGLHVLSLLEDRPMDDPEVVEKKKEIELSLAQESAGGRL